MVRLAIASDSHDRKVWLERFLALCMRERYDAVFHLGDLRSDARWLERRMDIPVIAVAGNCDVYSNHQRLARAAYEGCTLLAVHGHLQNVKYGFERLSYLAEEVGANIALFGHTHRPYAGWVGRAMLINPGALMDGRYAELTISGGDAVPMLKDLREMPGE